MLSAIREIIVTISTIILIFFLYIKLCYQYLKTLFTNTTCSLFVRITLGSIRTTLDLICLVIAKLLTRPQKDKVPPIIDRLLLQSAQDLTAQIKSGKLKSEILVKTFIDRIKTVQPFINATVDQRFAEAVLEAIEIDKRVQHELYGNDPLVHNRSIHDLPLLGIPFSCKDSIAIEGMAFESAMESRKGLKAKTDATAIKLLRESGAIPIVLTNIPEITMWWTSYNKTYGQTNNPYDLSRIPGGSSGGEGALIGSAGSVIGVGSDIGGSIRIPSFCCGIFGHKPTPGLIPIDNQYPVVTQEKIPFQTIGPMTRYAVDLLPMFKVMSEPNLHKLKNNEKVDLSKVKIYYMKESGNPFETNVSPDIKHSINRIVSHMSQKYGNYTKEVNLSQLGDGFLIWIYSLQQAKVPSLESELSNGNTPINAFLEIIKFIINKSKHNLNVLLLTAILRLLPKVDSEFGQKYVRLGRELKQELKQLLGKDGVLIYPTHPEPAPKHITNILKFTNISYTCVFNAMGLPVTACPLGLNKEGLPIGVQVIGSPFNDLLTMEVASELERAFGGWVSPSKIVC